METSGRDAVGRFIKGRKPSLEEIKKKEEGVKRRFETFIPSARLREQNPYIFNVWRSIFYTEKGKAIGCSTDEWTVFENFFADVFPTYKKGYRFHRIDTNLPHSKDNFIWVSPSQATLMSRKDIAKLEYNGETLTLREAAFKYNQSYNAVRQRYYKRKRNYSTEEIIFGKSIRRNSKIPKNVQKDSSEERAKASKLISSYKCKDKKLGFPVCDIDIDWMIENIMHKPCTYCGDTNKIGCDRIDNNKGHMKDNVIPCCYECNVARGNNFSYEEMRKLGQTIRTIKQERTQ